MVSARGLCLEDAYIIHNIPVQFEQTKQFVKIPQKIKKKLQSDNPSDISKVLEELEIKMFNAAQDLDFEEAARIRDEIKLIKDLNFGISYVESPKKISI